TVEFYLDGRKIMVKRQPPYTLDLDFGTVPQLRKVRAIAMDDKNQIVAGDELVVNTGTDPFRVRIVSPRVAVNLHGNARIETTVLANGHPLTNLPETAFKVLDDGKPVKVTKFDYVKNLPLSIGLAIDTSGSMLPRMSEAQKAASQFFSNVLRTGDKAFLVSFDTQ